MAPHPSRPPGGGDLALTLDVFIRMGSGILLLLLGLAALSVARRSPRGRAVGLFAASWGLMYVLTNLVTALGLGGVAAVAVAASFVVAAGAALLVIAEVPRRIERREAPVLLVGALLSLAASAPYFRPDVNSAFALAFGLTGRDAAWFVVPYVANLVATCAIVLVVSVRTAAARGLPPHEVAGAAAVVALVGLYKLFSIDALGGAQGTVGMLSLLVLVVGASGAWLVVGARTRTRPPVVVALALASAGLAGAVYHATLSGPSILELDPFGLYGITRILGWGALVYAILRADLLGVALPRFAAQRGTVAAAMLAAFFIAAQLAEGVLNASFGVLTGSLVAGAMLFAASPIQRAAERMLGGGAAPTRSLTPTAPSAHDAFRRAVLLAARKGALTRDDDEDLAHLAHELGLSPVDMVRLRREAEAEARR